VQKPGRARRPANFAELFFAFGKNSKGELPSLSFIFSIRQKACEISTDSFAMDKVCPCCKRSFECRNDDILECWCLEVSVSRDLRDYLARNYNDCLCRDCIEFIDKSLVYNHQLKITIENEKS
jgi:hypothetical protein